MKKLVLKKMEEPKRYGFIQNRNPYDRITPEQSIYDEIYNKMELLSGNELTFDEVYNNEIEEFHKRKTRN